jgi:O-antigen ligase
MKNTLDKLHSIFFILLGLSIPLSIAVSNIFIGLIVIIWIIEDDMKRKWGQIISSKWMSSILLLIILYCVGIIWGDIGVGKFQMLTLFLMFIILQTSRFKQSDLKLGTLCFLFATLLSALLSILINYNIILPLHNYISIISSRWHIAAFTSYNYHNILLAFSSLVCFYLFAEKKSQYRWVFLICIIIYSFSIFIERGRAGQLVLLLFLSIYSVYYFKRKIKYSIGIICFLITCNYVAYQESNTYKSRIERTLEAIESQKDIRFFLIKESINYIKKNPILGYGTGSFEKTMNKRIDENHPKLYTTPHNTYLYVWFEIGIFGLIILLNIFYFQIKSLSKLKYSFHRILLPIGFMIIMLFDSYLFSFVLTIFYIYFFTIYNNYKVDKTT